MARKKRPPPTSPKKPSRVNKRRTRKPRGEFHVPKPHPELVGLGLVGAGVFIAAVLWFGFSGGPVAHAVKAAVGAAAYLAPLILVPLGTLIVTRSALVDVRRLIVYQFARASRPSARTRNSCSNRCIGTVP